jgi:thymidylate synthase
MVLLAGVSVPADESKSIGANRPTRELQNFTLCIDNPRDRLIRLPKYKTPLISSIARFVWMMAGNNRLADIVFYEQKAKPFTDDGLTMPGSNYGMRMLQPRAGLNQLAGVISELQERPSSRRAMVAIYHPEDAIRHSSADIPCTFGFDYLVRAGELLATTIMRSNNAIALIGSAFVLRPRYLAVLSILASPRGARTVCKSPVPFKMWRAFVWRNDSTL